MGGGEVKKGEEMKGGGRGRMEKERRKRRKGT